MNRTRIRRAAVAASAALALAAFGTACEDTTAADTGSSSGSSKEKDKEAAPSKSTVEEFKEFVAKNGTDQEKSAVEHVTKVQGADNNNDILDTADVYTDFKGDLMDSDATGAAKLIASAFADFQADRGKGSKNGLVTVYNASGDMLGNGKF